MDGHGGSQENLPINCVNWYEAYAFCIWDGGFLPSEAEWEYAAAGGSQQREYPWGSARPRDWRTSTRFSAATTRTAGAAAQAGEHRARGYGALGAGLWGQLDMAGEVWEWNLDWYAPYAACVNCADATPGAARVVRGGQYDDLGLTLFPPYRNFFYPTARFDYIGFRCARAP